MLESLQHLLESFVVLTNRAEICVEVYIHLLLVRFSFPGDANALCLEVIAVR